MSVSRIFTLADQQAFAAASGDSNPLHVDAHWARTVFPGQVVVHGMHALLWALEALKVAKPPSGLRTAFLKPILLDETVTASRDGDGVIVSVRGQPMLVAHPLEATPFIPASDPARLPEIWRREGRVCMGNNASLQMLFAQLAAAWGDETVRGLAGLSALVGMECPGLYSMFSEFSVAFRPGASGLAYNVLRYDNRFSRLQIAVDGLGLHGTVDAFDTQPENAAPEGTDQVPLSRDYEGQSPLIVGGSSGLGAATAELLARGGARPIVTYLGSPDGAKSLKARIEAAGGMCELLRFDAANPAEGLAALNTAGWQGREVYYFASPRIFRRRLETYQTEDFHDFVRIYVDGFYDLLSGLFQHAGTAEFRVFYPSSVAVEPLLPDMIEYALAKQAGESLCAQLLRKHRGLFIRVERLPRIETRQTKSTFKVAAKTPAEVMVPILRDIQGRI